MNFVLVDTRLMPAMTHNYCYLQDMLPAEVALTAYISAYSRKDDVTLQLQLAAVTRDTNTLILKQTR